MKYTSNPYHQALACVSSALLLFTVSLPASIVQAQSDQQKTTHAQNTEAQSNTTYPLNINKVDVNALLTIPGIGKSRAEAIIAYRDEHGPFTSLERLADVRGVSPSFVEKRKQYMTVN